MSEAKSSDEGKDQMKVKAAKARAESLSNRERSAIAKKAAAARWRPDVPVAEYEGEIPFAGQVIPCAVLPDGRRVLSERGVTKGFGMKRAGSNWQKKSESGARLPVFASADNLKPFMDEELRVALSVPVLYRPTTAKGSIAYGTPAEVIPKICNVWLKARDADALKGPHQELIAVQADLIMRGLAEVGIIALIDEATGYQDVRDRKALQEVLDKFLRKEFAAWAKTFPDEFYRQIFRLRNWKWMGMAKNRPQCVANYTKDLIYARLAPGILEELESRNPVLENGRRKGKHFQLLTDNIGHPALAQHMHATIGLMRASDSWSDLLRMMDRSFPKRGDTLQLPLFTDEQLNAST